MLGNKYDLTIQQGSTYDLVLTLKDDNGNTRNLVSYTARMQIRPSYSSSTIVADLSTANGEIVIDGANGTVRIGITAANTANIKVDLTKSAKPPYSTYVYDLETTDSIGKVSKLMYGDVTVYGEVTR